MPFTERQLKEAFELFDADGSGFVEPEELVLVFKGLGHKATLEEVYEMMAEMDKDRNCKVDFAEFCQLMQKQVQDVAGPAEVLAAFKAFDMSGTGEITKDDLRAVAASLCERVTDQDIDEIYHYCSENDKTRHGDKRFTFYAWRSVMDQVFHRGPRATPDPSRITLPAHDDSIWDDLERQERTDRKEREAELASRKAFLEERNEQAKLAKEAIAGLKENKQDSNSLMTREAKWRQKAEEQEAVRERLAKKKHILTQQRREEAELASKAREEERALLRKLEEKKAMAASRDAEEAS